MNAIFPLLPVHSEVGVRILALPWSPRAHFLISRSSWLVASNFLFGFFELTDGYHIGIHANQKSTMGESRDDVNGLLQCSKKRDFLFSFLALLFFSSKQFGGRTNSFSSSCALFSKLAGSASFSSSPSLSIF